MFDEFVQIGFGGLMMMAGFDFVVDSLLFLGRRIRRFSGELGVPRLDKTSGGRTFRTKPLKKTGPLV